MNDKFNYILELQNQGLSRHEIKDKLGYKSIDSLTKFMKKRGYSFSISDNKYVLADSACMTPQSSSNQVISTNTPYYDYKGMTEDMKQNLMDLASNYDKIQDIINWFNNKDDDKSMTSVVEIINDGIKINLQKSDSIRTTIRINELTWNKFNNFVSKNKEFHKQDLLAQALEDFINKHDPN